MLFLVEPTPLISGTSWKEKLKVLMQDKKLRDQIGAKGRRRVCEKNSILAQKKSYLEVFQGQVISVFQLVQVMLHTVVYYGLLSDF